MKLILFIFLFSIIINSDFKNVQVLNIESKKEMKKYMKSISKDLGAKCKDCHYMDDFSIDNPMKNKAREMIILTRQINIFRLANRSNNMNKVVIYFTKDIPLSKNNFYSSLNL